MTAESPTDKKNRPPTLSPGQRRTTHAYKWIKRAVLVCLVALVSKAPSRCRSWRCTTATRR